MYFEFDQVLESSSLDKFDAKPSIRASRVCPDLVVYFILLLICLFIINYDLSQGKPSVTSMNYKLQMNFQLNFAPLIPIVKFIISLGLATSCVWIMRDLNGVIWKRVIINVELMEFP